MDSIFHATMLALERDLQCRLIASDLVLGEGLFSSCTSEQEILTHACERGYSRIALHEEDGGSDPRITRLVLVDLKKQRFSESRDIAVEDVIAGSTPIGRAIYLLSQRPFYFILDPARIGGILTRSDLNRLPARTYLHTLLDHLEQLMAVSCDRQFPGDTWMHLFSKDKQDKLDDLQAKKRRQDFDTALIDCTYLPDKGRIFEQSPELQRKLGLAPQDEFDTRFKPIRDLRNQLDHGGALVKKGDMEWLDSTVRTVQEWIAALSKPDAGQIQDGA